jgi:hypothetical protein
LEGYIMAIKINADTTNGLVITPDTSGEIEFQQNGTKMIKFGPDGLELPTWTTATRPASPAQGYLGFNTTTNEPEWYDSANGQWFSFRTDPTQYSSDYLIVAGGGGGGGATRGAGGGAGGMLTGTTNLIRGTTYNVTIGSGGASGAYSTNYATNNKGTQGVNSTALGLTAIGGGFGQGGDGFGTAGSGGSGGGAWYTSGGASGGAGTTGQGNKGGDGGTPAPYGAGGGGAGQEGFDFNDASTPQEGGDGLQSSITGTATYYAGGGSASDFQANSGRAGGLGGGGVGRNAIGTTVGTSPMNGTANLGGGGGASGNGGSGVVIFRVLTSDYSGTTTGSPTVTTDGSYTVIKFTASGSYTA